MVAPVSTVSLLLASLLALSWSTFALVAASQSLPGADGPRFQLVGKAPHDLEIVDVFVYARPDEAAANAPRPNRFPSGTRKLTLDIRIKELRRLGTVIRFDLTTAAGEVDMDEGFFSFARLEREGVSSMELDLVPKRGVYADGPHRLELFMNDVLVAVLNWTIG